MKDGMKDLINEDLDESDVDKTDGAIISPTLSEEMRKTNPQTLRGFCTTGN